MGKGKILWGLLLVGVFGAGCSHSSSFSEHPQSSSKAPKAAIDSDTKEYLQQKGKGTIPSFDIPIVMNDRVLAWVDYFQGSSHERFERYLQRSGRYITAMRQMLKEEGLPQDLVYLALIESGFSTQAYSRAKAAGPWQFMRATGNHYGLSTNGWADERRDPEKATIAAAQYLKKLYNDFGDWYLAMAAYNAGEGKIGSAIRKSGTRDFWKMTAPGKRYLKPETRDYVPKFIAAAIIAKNPERFGFNDVSYHEPLVYDRVKVEGPVDFTVAATCAGVDEEQIILLNPELHHRITPPAVYQLKIPQGTKKAFEVAYAQLPPDQRVMVTVHTVRKGETLRSIAKRYGVSTQTVMSMNGIQGKHPKATPGTVLTIPKGKAAQLVAQSNQANQGRRLSYRVKKNDSLQKIASKFDVSVAQIKKENHIKGNAVRPGQRLKITTGSSSMETGDLLAYNKKSKHTRMNGVEYLIRKQQNMDTTSSDVASDEETAAVAPDAVAIDDSEAESEQKPEHKTDHKIVANVSAPVEEKTVGQEEEIEPNSEEAVIVPTKVAKKTATATSKKHVVKKGDSLIKLAKHYQVSVTDLKEWNHLKGSGNIRMGQTLIIRQQKSKAATSKPASAPSTDNAKALSPQNPQNAEDGF